MAQTSNTHPNFDNPPINEVACGIQFERIESLLNPYLGILWEKFKPEYPTCQEVAPLVPVIENFDRPTRPTSQYVDLPPHPRTWFLHSNGNGIIQVQRDRFHHNWREIRPDDIYPRYEYVIEMFQKHLAKFTEFLKENNLGTINPLQYELTYINLITQGDGWDTIADIGKIFPNFSWHNSADDFLPIPESLNWYTTFVIPERAGRLHIRIQNAFRRDSEQPLLRLELTARGIGELKTLEEMWSWFDLAHEWIVSSFKELTHPQVQRNVWGLQE